MWRTKERYIYIIEASLYSYYEYIIYLLIMLIKAIKPLCISFYLSSLLIYINKHYPGLLTDNNVTIDEKNQ